MNRKKDKQRRLVKLVTVVVMLCALSPMGRVEAQISSIGVQAGAGYSRLVDNIVTKGGAFGAMVGGYVTYEFSDARSVIANNLYLQGGLNLVRRGGAFEEQFTISNYKTTCSGYYHAWYAQIPVLVSYRYELPIRSSGHYLRAFVGPAFSVGLFGHYSARSISPHRPQTSVNYNIENDPAFSHMNRIDVDAIIGVGYQFENIVANLYVDYGFLAVDKDTDVLKALLSEDAKDAVVPGGNLVSFMLSIGYQFPSKK